MFLSIFNLDWIFIDTIIIILLFILLISVKIFKGVYRWRSSISNEALEHKFYKEPNRIFKNDNLSIKKWCLTRNLVFENKSQQYPTVLFLRANRKKKLLKVLTEGLVSYGFNVMNIKLKVKHSSSERLLDDVVQEETSHAISIILNNIQSTGLSYDFKCVVINYYKMFVSYSLMLSNSGNFRIIFINPKLNSSNLRNIVKTINSPNLKSQIVTIFSEKTKFFLKNKNLKNLENKIKSTSKCKVVAVNKAKSSFKYYETILLGIIIELIEKNLFKI